MTFSSPPKTEASSDQTLSFNSSLKPDKRSTTNPASNAPALEVAKVSDKSPIRSSAGISLIFATSLLKTDSGYSTLTGTCCPKFTFRTSEGKGTWKNFSWYYNHHTRACTGMSWNLWPPKTLQNLLWKVDSQKDPPRELSEEHGQH